MKDIRARKKETLKIGGVYEFFPPLERTGKVFVKMRCIMKTPGIEDTYVFSGIPLGGNREEQIVLKFAKKGGPTVIFLSPDQNLDYPPGKKLGFG